MTIIHRKDSPFRNILKISLIVIIVLIALNFLTGLFTQDILHPDIIIIPVTGEISLSGGGGLFGGGGLTADEVVEQIENADSDSGIHAIILEINSPGGTVVASGDIAKAISSAEKPVIAWMREIATSGGYWIAASSDKIIADPATITGSIGVTGSYVSLDGFFDEYGLKYERLVSGKYKDTGTPYRNLTADEKNLLIGKIHKINELFIAHVSETRSMSVDEVRKVATGEIFLGLEALNLGLIDILGGKAEAVAAAEQLAGIEDARVAKYEKSVGILDRLSALTSIVITIEPSSSFAIKS